MNKRTEGENYSVDNNQDKIFFEVSDMNLLYFK